MIKVTRIAGVVLVLALPARAQTEPVPFPHFDVPANCKAHPGGDPAYCIMMEYNARELAELNWSRLPSAVQRECAEAAVVGGNYMSLASCVQGHSHD